MASIMFRGGWNDIFVRVELLGVGDLYAWRVDDNSFMTAFISGGIMTWGKQVIGGRDHPNSSGVGGGGVGYKEKGDDTNGETTTQIMMEEGQPLLSATFSSGKEGE
eukprot:CAMPEP_0202018836 /NCGR_PEP_ID=MMETSP0905-20130828/40458_1 /ASSEMBLY_ACC=CAM_ASM_000554 /TAXON_ID=420261 /ORGANISM="Thalassiosira antarctica, Strain CCMP982" /LENGTH=105 /DNA_ID=CAMNT_0048579909 /DNA_START=63 /DNA_END=378 /DNA_ORIENTATION=-